MIQKEGLAGMPENNTQQAKPSHQSPAFPRRIFVGLMTPVLRLTLSLAVVLVALAATLTLRANQPDIAPGLLLASPPGEIGVKLGDGRGQLLSLSFDGGPPVAVPPDLGVEDPDMLPTYADRAAFREAQATIMGLVRAAIADGKPLVATVQPDDGSAPTQVAFSVAAHTPLWTLPAAFWVQIVCGTIVLMIAAFFFALRPGSARVRAAEGLEGFILAGLGVGGAAFSAAIYSSRALVMEPWALALTSAGNHVSTLVFGIGMIALFARYPRPVARRSVVGVSAGLVVASILLYRFELAPHDFVRPQNLTGVIFLGIIALILLQLRATKRKPADRAALRWLGLSFLLGSGVFIMMVALPVALERDSIMSQGMSFIPLCAIYVGTALAFARYRLFDLDRWAWRILFHLGVIALLICVDLVVLLTLSLSGPASMTFAVLMVGLIYFPLRDQVFDRWLSPHRPDLAAIYADTVSIAFQVGPATKAAAWRALLQRLFTPLHMEPVDVVVTKPDLEAEGLGLLVPAANGAPALRLSHARQGRRLFNSADAALVTQVNDLVHAAEADRMAYEQALTEERRRIARDLHDDVGANLLSGLHARDETQRQNFLVEALADLRQIASGIAGRSVTLEDQIAEMRSECRNRAEAQGGRLVWPLGSADEAADPLSYETQRNLTAILREALSNALAHGGKGQITVRGEYDRGQLTLSMENPLSDTAQQPSETLRRGNGTANMAARAAALGGTISAQPQTDRGCYLLVLTLPVIPKRPVSRAVGSGVSGAPTAGNLPSAPAAA